MQSLSSFTSETRTRTIVKAVIWNLIGLAVMALVGFLLTGSWGIGGAMAIINACVGLTTYIVYERIWAHIQWGRHAAH
ncbi:DUF2061 domain-containing protein [Cognatishimia sp. MH4019]|uniref:DUF2061 domain-containing protein n=1 Tax=Cognatishimia sp. MH4019 TaxID=2854030 RepID=UPI001CD6D166|nr:DUF2061 domain-containing protein [Cognatishimia sp. MH4019]